VGGDWHAPSVFAKEHCTCLQDHFRFVEEVLLSIGHAFACIGDVSAFLDERFVFAGRLFVFVGCHLLLVEEHFAFVEDRFDFIDDVFEAIYDRFVFVGRFFAAIDAIFVASDALSSFIEEHRGERNEHFLHCFSLSARISRGCPNRIGGTSSTSPYSFPLVFQRKWDLAEFVPPINHRVFDLSSKPRAVPGCARSTVGCRLCH